MNRTAEGRRDFAEQLLNERFVEARDRNVLERRYAERVLGRGAHLAGDEHEERWALRAISVRVPQLDELCARHREVGRDVQLAVGKDDDRVVRQLGAKARAEPNHQLGVEVADAHAVTSDSRTELLHEKRHSDVLEFVGELRCGQLQESGAHG